MFLPIVVAAAERVAAREIAKKALSTATETAEAAKATVSKKIQESLDKPTATPTSDDRKENFRYQENQDEEEVEDEIEQGDNSQLPQPQTQEIEESLSEGDGEKTKREVPFPIGMFWFTVVKESGDVFLSALVAAFAGIGVVTSITGVGAVFGLGTSFVMWGLSFISNISYFLIFFFWFGNYSKKFADYSDKIGVFRRLGYKFFLRLVLKFIPFLNILPLQTWYVLMIYNKEKKLNK
jgi:hypothetical protein